MENMSVTNMMPTHFEIIESVLQFLNRQDLNKAALVCKSWREAVLKIKKGKTNLHLTIQQPPREFGAENIFDCCVNKEHLPQACITFIHKDVYNMYSSHLSNTQPCSTIQSKLQECTPCPNILIATDLCISDQLKCFTYCYFVAPNPPLEHVYLTLSIPYRRNVNVEVFEMELDKIEQGLKSKLLICNLKCAFLFYDQSKYDCATTFNSMVNDIMDKNPGLHLCVIDSESMCDGNTLKCILFSGENVLVSSVTVPESANNNENMKEYISKLTMTKYGKYSVAFMFAGSKRMNLYENDVTEFQKQFPGMEITGMKCKTVHKYDFSACHEIPHKDSIYSEKCNQIFLISWN